MGVLADEYIRLRPDVSRMGREVRKAGADAGKTFGNSFGNAAKALLAGGAILGAAAVVKGIKTAVLAASDMNETANKSRIIFGKLTPVVTKFASTAAKDLGLTKQQALEAAASFGDMFTQIGFTGKEVTRMSLGVVRLSADLGSFNNLPTEDVQQRIAAAFRGEYDSLQALVPTINAATVQTRAMNDTGKKNAQQLTAQEKAAATLAIIMESTERASGDFARTQGGLANQIKIAKAQLGDMAVQVGTLFLPALTKLFGYITEKIIPAFSDFFKNISKNKELKTAVQDLKDALTILTGDQNFKQSLDGIAAALPGIVQGLANVVKKYGEISDAIDKFENKSFGEGDKTGGPVGQIIKDFGPGGTIERALIYFRTAAVAWVKKMWVDVKASFVENHSQILSDVNRFVSRVVGWFAGLPGRVMAWIRKLWADAKASFRTNHATILADVQRFLTGMLTRFGTWFATLKTRWGTFWAGIKTTGSTAINSVRTTISTVLTRITSAFSTAKANIKRIWDGLKGVVSAPVQWIKNNVYNKPLVPVWNRVASLVSGPKLSAYARGTAAAEPYGIRPGYTPGRDTHLIAVGGGEPILRPEAGRALGPDWVNGVNRSARTSGVGGVRRFLAEGGQGFQSGGVVGWMQGLAGRAASSITGLAAKLKGWAIGGLRAVAAKVLNPVKGLIDQAMPGSGVGRTVGGIGKKAIDLVLDKIQSADAAAVAAAAATQGAYTGPPGTGSRGLTTWHGGRFTQRFRNTLEMAQKLNGYINVIQGGFRPRTSYSGTSHAGDAIDTSWNSSKLSAMRRAGIAAWHRTPAQGFSHHIHGIPLPGRGYPGGSGIWQAQDYLRGGNGLAGGGIVAGGRGGLNTWIGEGRRDELVSPIPKGWSPANQDAKLDRLIAAIERNGVGGGTTVNLGGVHNPLPEKPSITVNKVMQRVAGLGLV